MALNTDDSFADVSPFFTPGVPPPTLPIPIAQTEVGKILSPGKLLAEEEIGPQSKAHRNVATRFSPYPKPPLKQKFMRFARSRSRTPNAATVTPRAASPSDEESCSQLSESDPSQESSSDDDEVNLIPKPEGEAGRPGRGGYNLEEKLAWQKKDFQQIKKYVKTLIHEHLDPSRSFASQAMASVIVVRNLAAARFPILLGYAQSWPATDLIRLQLKYTSGRARHAKDKEDAKAGKRLRRSSRK